MLSRKRVTDLTVEGMVIVVSILLAFALEAWWDARGQRQEETQILENLQVEFREAGAQLRLGVWGGISACQRAGGPVAHRGMLASHPDIDRFWAADCERSRTLALGPARLRCRAV